MEKFPNTTENSLFSGSFRAKLGNVELKSKFRAKLRDRGILEGLIERIFFFKFYILLVLDNTHGVACLNFEQHGP